MSRKEQQVADKRIVRQTRVLQAGMMGHRHQYRVYEHVGDGDLPENSEVVADSTPLTNGWCDEDVNGLKPVRMK